jgi:hypothetical protein
MVDNAKREKGEVSSTFNHNKKADVRLGPG